MDTESIYTVVITALSVLGSASAWKYYEKRASIKLKQENLMKDDCRERIEKLEILLERSATEKDNMRNEILKLTEEVAALRVRVEFLDKENKQLTNYENLSGFLNSHPIKNKE